MTLLSGNEILTAVKSICKANTECYLAVSYWSGDAAEAMGILNNENAHVVLDVNSGGTSASELVTLMKRLGAGSRFTQTFTPKSMPPKSPQL